MQEVREYRVVSFGAVTIPPNRFGAREAAEAYEEELHRLHGFGRKGLPQFAVTWESEPGVFDFSFETGPGADPKAVAKMRRKLQKK